MIWNILIPPAPDIRLWKKESWSSSPAPLCNLNQKHKKEPHSSLNTQSWETHEMHTFFWWYGIFAHTCLFSKKFWWEPRHLFFNCKKKKEKKKIARPRHFAIFSDQNQGIYFSWPNENYTWKIMIVHSASLKLPHYPCSAGSNIQQALSYHAIHVVLAQTFSKP